MDSLGIQCQLLHEGHTLKTYVKSKESHDVGEGIIDRVDDYTNYLHWADVVVVDCTGFGKLADKWRAMGIKVVSGTAATDLLEEDRAYGMKIMEEYGLTTPEWFGPFSLKQAQEFVKKNPERYVLKPNGQQDRDLTHVARDADDMIRELDRIMKVKKSVGTVILQQFIDGHEIAVGSTFCKNKFVMPYQINWEHKKLYPSNLGVNTGEQGTVCYYENHGNPLIDEFKKLEPWLKETGYSTDFDLNFMVTEKDAYVLEPTTRFGYPAIMLQAYLQEQEFGDYLYELAEGTLTKLPMKKPWVTGVVLSAPGYPFKESYLKHGKDKQMPFITEDFDPDMYFYEVAKDKNGYKTSGSSGAILVSVGRGGNLEASIEDCYAKIKMNDFPSWLAYRDDIGEKLVDEEFKWFQKTGWI